jgi:ADP-heptose:LPS heptosyltransferase
VERRGKKVVLALRALNLGDLLVAVPALRALRRAHPDHRLVLATPPALAPIAALTGAVDELLPAEDRVPLPWSRRPPELAVNLHGTGPQSHAILDALAPQRRIGFRIEGWDGPEWSEVAQRHAHERERWCALLTHHGIPADPSDLRLDAPPAPARPAAVAPVLVHPGARYGAKRWPVNRFAELAAALTRAGQLVLVTGSAAERPLAAAVARTAGLGESRVLAGRTDLAQLCTLVAGAGLVISGDTGIAHLASAFGTPSVVLFGPVDPAQWGPPVNGPHIALTGLGGPGGAVRRGDPFANEPDPALLAVQVPDVLRAAAAAQALPRVSQPVPTAG